MLFEDFREFFKSIMSLYYNDVKEERISSYFMILKDYDFEQIKDAVLSLVKKNKYMPTIAEIVQEIENGGYSEEELAAIAWEKVWNAVPRIGTYKTVIFDDPYIHQALHMMGGWANLGQALVTEEPKLRKEFVYWYKIYKKKRDLSYVPDLPGWLEVEANNNGHDVKSTPAAVGDIQKVKWVYKLIYGEEPEALEGGKYAAKAIAE